MTEFKSKSEIALSMLPDSFRGRVLEVKIDVDRAEFLTDFDKPYEPAQPVHLPRYVKKGRDARPSRNPFAEPSVSKQRGKNDVLRKARRVR